MEENQEAVEQVETQAVEEVKSDTPLEDAAEEANEPVSNEFEKIKEAQEQLETLKSYNQEVEETGKYEYDAELDQWVGEDGKFYDKKPETVANENSFDPYDWQVKQANLKIEQAKKDLIASKERECISAFEKGFANYKEVLTQANWEILKHDVVDPAMREFSDAITNDKYDADTLKRINENIKNGIEARLSLYNLNAKAQEQVNASKNANYPLEGVAPTNEQGIIDSGTFEGLSRQQRENKLQGLITKFTHNKL